MLVRGELLYNISVFILFIITFAAGRMLWGYESRHLLTGILWAIIVILADRVRSWQERSNPTDAGTGESFGIASKVIIILGAFLAVVQLLQWLMVL